MPHSTIEHSPMRRPSSSASRTMPPFKFPNNSNSSIEKFPDHNDDFFDQPSTSSYNAHLPASAGNERWQSRRERAPGWSTIKGKHGRQPSLSEAFRTIRARRASVSENVHEVAQALKAPVSPKLIVCLLLPYNYFSHAY